MAVRLIRLQYNRREAGLVDGVGEPLGLKAQAGVLGVGGSPLALAPIQEVAA